MAAEPKRRRIALPERGVEIALLDWEGDGPVALLHHANGFCAGTWGPVAGELRRHFRVLAVDARGHGDSSTPEGAENYRWGEFGADLAAVARRLVDEHGGAPLALGLGHSFGGTSMLMASAADPRLFERLVLVDPVVPPPGSAADPQRRAHTAELVDRALRRRHVFESREAAREAWSEKSFFAGWDPRALDLYLAEALRDRGDGQVELKCTGAVEAAVFEAGREYDIWPVAARVRAPTLILWAERDSFPRHLYETLAEKMAEARIVDAHCGHLVPMERPDFVVDQVLRFTGRRAGPSPREGRPRSTR